MSNSPYDILRGRGLIPPSPQTLYPFPELEPGDAFFIPAPASNVIVLNAARRYREKHNSVFKIKTRKEVHNGQPGLMVYCISTDPNRVK